MTKYLSAVRSQSSFQFDVEIWTREKGDLAKGINIFHVFMQEGNKNKNFKLNSYKKNIYLRSTYLKVFRANKVLLIELTIVNGFKGSENFVSDGDMKK